MKNTHTHTYSNVYCFYTLLIDYTPVHSPDTRQAEDHKVWNPKSEWVYFIVMFLLAHVPKGDILN